MLFTSREKIVTMEFANGHILAMVTYGMKLGYLPSLGTLFMIFSRYCQMPLSKAEEEKTCGHREWPLAQELWAVCKAGIFLIQGLYINQIANQIGRPIENVRSALVSLCNAVGD